MATPPPPQLSSTSTQPPSPSSASSNPQQPSPPKTQPPLPRFLDNDPARTGYDPTVKWWLNYFRIMTGQVTREGVEHYREDRYKANEARDCARCEADRAYLFAYSPTIRFLRDKVAALNGTLDETNVVCRRCPARVAEDGRVIRASMLSGECRWTRETMTRGNWTLTQQFQNCVRMRAIQSVMARPTCRDDVHATKVVNEVWDSCFSDKRPFEEVYR
ncbi:hypothetical protein CHGG_03377 [Chaetomium globosum CBS 148.51]|uniref:uncharacterized protein n=1 Tax=Chaetomium globosum (strain ATCC 6205 / CBS 148.51 / DSM 1962 / NBRC 6347 / NRRL 1970) TaxID=306901 RepID=UPI00006A9366|nr:uncharacterized protein CHGG_03377 [Chaetomium globosum CBS 148.51]EAQ91442.1 hypothetical protein CHGG_03377 [Chaetomium globosum CBS 148.51]